MILKHKAQQLIPNVAAIASKYPELANVLSEIIDMVSGLSRNVYDDIQSLDNTRYTSTSLPAASAEMLGKTAIVTSGAVTDYRICIVSGSAYVWKTLKIE